MKPLPDYHRASANLSNRSGINQKHDLVDVIFLVISAIMAGDEGWRNIEIYGDSKAVWLKQYRPFQGCIPRRYTIARILRAIIAESLLEALLNWANERRIHLGKPIIAFNREILRGDIKKVLRLVTAYDVENGLVLTQKATPNKKSEIGTVRDILETLDVKGTVVTIDALHCQRETLEKISEKKGHVVVQVKLTNLNYETLFHQSFKSFLMQRKRR